MKLAPLFFLLAACPSSAPVNTEQPPRDLTYGTAVVGEVGVALEARFPSYDGGIPDTFTLSGMLPAGLVLSPTTGAISGTPAVVSPLATYTVTASNALGSTTGTFELQVEPTRVAPSGLTYANASVSYVRNEVAPANTATLAEGSPPFSFSVVPALPAGLTLDATTGTIGGTPTAVQPSTTYTITCANVKGSTQATIQIAVTATLQAPDITGYSSAVATYQVGVPAPTNSPMLAGGPVSSFSIEPALPEGLAFSTTNGRITGTATAESPQATYEVTATNAAGMDSFALTITVAAPTMPTGNYGTTEVTYLTPGTRIAPLAIVGPTGSGWTYTVDQSSDAFPTGVTVNSTTGEIRGIPVGNQTGSNYKVRISNGPSLFVVVDVPLTFTSLGNDPADETVELTVNNVDTACPMLGVGDGALVVNRLDTIEWSSNSSAGWRVEVSSDAFTLPSTLINAQPQRIGVNTVGEITWSARHVLGSFGPCGSHTINVN